MERTQTSSSCSSNSSFWLGVMFLRNNFFASAAFDVALFFDRVVEAALSCNNNNDLPLQVVCAKTTMHQHRESISR